MVEIFLSIYADFREREFAFHLFLSYKFITFFLRVAMLLFLIDEVSLN